MHVLLDRIWNIHQVAREHSQKDTALRYLLRAEESLIRLAGTTGRAQADEIVELFLSLAERVLDITETANNNEFIAFCKKFDLSENPENRVGYDKLKATGFDKAELSVRVTNVLESENMRTMIEPCLLNEHQLLYLNGFGETSLKEVVAKAREISGLKLVWK